MARAKLTYPELRKDIIGVLQERINPPFKIKSSTKFGLGAGCLNLERVMYFSV